MARRTTLNDVAAVVGVSPRTVSRVVNNEDGYSEQTRQKVTEAISELGYRPNLLARGLITQRTGMLALVVPQMLDPFFSDVAHGVQTAAHEHGATLFLSGTDNDPAQQRQVFNSLVSHGVDGAIVFPAPGGDNDIRALADNGTPVVVVDQDLDHPGIGLVASDLSGGVDIAVDHLNEQDHRCIAMIANEVSPADRRIRERAFSAALERVGLPPGPIVRAQPTVEGGQEATTEVLSRYPSVTAIFAYNDLMAAGAVAASIRLGRRVPGTLAVVGFDDIGLAELLAPALTTVRIDRTALGAEAVRVLLAMAERPASSVERVVRPVSLVQRQSA